MSKTGFIVIVGVLLDGCLAGPNTAAYMPGPDYGIAGFW